MGKLEPGDAMLSLKSACGIARASATGARAKSTFRLNAATGEWVVFAQGRRNRPKQTSTDMKKRHKPSEQPAHDDKCPFCAGNEAQTPPSWMELKDSSGKWELRVIDNKFPAVVPVESLSQPLDLSVLADDVALNNEIPAVGKHEVIIESPAHNGVLALAGLPSVERLCHAWRERGRAMQSIESIRHIMFFKNSGGSAGASLMHPHSQVVGLPIVPDMVYARQRYARQWMTTHDQSVFAQMATQELAAAERVIDESHDFMAIVPYAAISPFTVWVLPKPHAQQALFTETADDHLADFALMLHSALRRLHRALDEPDFNLVVHSAPLSDRGKTRAFQPSAYFSWYASISPRLGAGALAGFEFGSGIFSNGNLPEHDAATLKATSID